MNKITWQHPGGKFRRLGSHSCSESELIAIILGSGTKGKSAVKISQELIDKYGTINDLVGLSLKDLMKIKGLKEVKATKLAALFEVANRIIKGLERK